MRMKLTHPIIHEYNLSILLEGVNSFEVFCKKIEKAADELSIPKKIDKRLGDFFEVFGEALNKHFNNLYISEYKVNSTNDYGVDAYGIGLNNKPATIQFKYRRNASVFLNANDDHLSNFAAQSLFNFNVDPTDFGNLLLFTNAAGINKEVLANTFGNKMRCINGEEIANLVRNRVSFWEDFRRAVLEASLYKKEEYFNQITYMAKTPIGQSKSLYYYQAEAIAKMAETNRGIINLPTGTGKTTIIANAISDTIVNNPEMNEIFVLISPRILLSSQLVADVKDSLDAKGIAADYQLVNSGKALQADLDTSDALTELEKVEMEEKGYFKIKSTTQVEDIKYAAEYAKSRNLPLIISATYHSMPVVKAANLKITNIYCDEAHHLLTSNFNWIVRTDSGLQYDKLFNFTATLRNTISAEDVGMNNTTLYGDIIYQKSPAAMVQGGYILRPRLHYVLSEGMHGTEVDPSSIAKAFDEHKSLLRGSAGAKVLVICKGVSHVNDIYNSKSFQDLQSRGIKTFAIVSGTKPLINNESVTREAFLKAIRNLSDSDNAIILHVRILTEGIDVPGITGIMPLDGQSVSQFLQNLGRATRLNNTDRKDITSGIKDTTDLSDWIKPYAYIIIPNFTKLGDGLIADLSEKTKMLREFDFIPTEDVVMKLNSKALVPTPISLLNDDESVEVKSIKEKVLKLTHEIEDEKSLSILNDETLSVEEAVLRFTLRK